MSERLFSRKAVAGPVSFLLVSGLLFVVFYEFMPGNLVGGDGTELTYGMKYLVPVHPPGYPLYVILGHAFVDLTPLDHITGAHAVSGVYAALSFGLLFLYLRRRNIHLIPSLTSIGLLMASPIIWPMSVEAEVYSLAMLFFAGTLLLWDWTLKNGGGFYLLWFWVGLSLTHHPIGLLNIAFAIHASVFSGVQLRRTTAFVLFATPGLLYLTILLPGLSFPFDWPTISSLRDLVRHMLGGSFTRFFFDNGSFTLLQQLVRALKAHFVVFPFGAAVLFLSGYPLTRGWERFLIKVQASFLILLLPYGIPDLSDLLVPSYVIGAVMLGRSLQYMHDECPGYLYIASILICVVSTLLFVRFVGFTYDRGRYYRFDTFVQKTDKTVDRGTIIADWGSYTPLRYHQLSNQALDRVRILILPKNYDLSSIINVHQKRNLPLYLTARGFWNVPNGSSLRGVKSVGGLYKVSH